MTSGVEEEFLELNELKEKQQEIAVGKYLIIIGETMAMLPMIWFSNDSLIALVRST
jgi:hypothetical protein